MKKFLVTVLVSCMLLSLSGCSSISKLLDKKEDGIVAADASTLDDGREVDGYGEGRVGDLVNTAWFDFTVNSTTFADEYEGRKAEDGKELVVVNLTVKNTFDDKLPMWGDDFQIQWGEGDADYGYSIPSFSDKMMPDEFELARAESKTADVVYEIPKENSGEFSLSFLEVYEDDVQGNTYFVYFEKEKK